MILPPFLSFSVNIVSLFYVLICVLSNFILTLSSFFFHFKAFSVVLLHYVNTAQLLVCQDYFAFTC